MDFQKVEACCADMVIIVRDAVCRLFASKPMTGFTYSLSFRYVFLLSQRNT